MKRSLAFAAAAAGLVVAGVVGASPFLAADARRAVLGAGALALGVQLPMHALLRGWRARNDRFLAAIALGFFARAALLAAGVGLFVLPGRVAAAPFLPALGAFVLGLLVAETVFERRRRRRGTRAVTS